MTQSIQALKARLTDIAHLHRAAAVLEWDMQTYMPPGGAPARADQMALLSKVAHEQFVSPETGQLLEKAEAEAQGMASDSDEARLVRNVRRQYDREVKIPVELATEFARHTALSQEIWTRARASNDFASFAPSLEKTLDLVRKMVECLGYTDDPYDPLLDAYEPYMKTAQVAAIFADLKPRLVALARAIAESPRAKEEVALEGLFPIEAQNALTKRLVQAIGYDMQRGRQDQAAHPFCTTFSTGDVRITTRFSDSAPTMALYASLHEAGHAMYEQGIPQAYDNTPLGGGVSSGVHESQSRLWENLVGRSRPFCAYVLPLLKEMFPDALTDCDVERFYRAVNRVRPSFIRVEADEVTYNLHILLRFELERDLLADRLKVRDLPEAWNAKMREYLGITPPNDTLGVLQDIHWSAGMIGYFPTYTLGNLIAAQLWHTIRQAIPDLDAQIARGEFAPLLGWLREKIHRAGSKFTPDELIRKATGEPLSADHFTQYLQTKFGELYGLI